MFIGIKVWSNCEQSSLRRVRGFSGGSWHIVQCRRSQDLEELSYRKHFFFLWGRVGGAMEYWSFCSADPSFVDWSWNKEAVVSIFL